MPDIHVVRFRAGAPALLFDCKTLASARKWDAETRMKNAQYRTVSATLKILLGTRPRGIYSAVGLKL